MNLREDSAGRAYARYQPNSTQREYAPYPQQGHKAGKSAALAAAPRRLSLPNPQEESSWQPGHCLSRQTQGDICAWLLLASTLAVRSGNCAWLPAGILGSKAEAKSGQGDRKSTRLNSSHANISYAVFCLKKKK